MEFSIEKCAMLEIESVKQHITEGVQQLNQVVIRRIKPTYTWGYWKLTSSNKWK